MCTLYLNDVYCVWREENGETSKQSIDLAELFLGVCGVRMETFGGYLKRQRVDRNVSLRKIAHLTMISEWYLDSIEKNDFSKLPKGPYTRSYISSYATSIGMNAEEVLKQFDSFCQEKDKAEDIKKAIPEDKKGKPPIAFLVGGGRLLFLCFIILILSAFGFYQFFPLNQTEVHGVAISNIVPPSNLEYYATSVSSPGSIEKHLARGDNKKISQEAPLSAGEPDPPLQVPQRLANLSPLLSKTQVEMVRETSNVQKMDIHSQNTPKIEPPAFTTPLLLDYHDSSKIFPEKKQSVQPRKGPMPARASLGVSPSEQSREPGLDHENDMEVLKAAVCTDVKDRVPYGEADSFQWSKNRIYVWNLIKYKNLPSSIRHVYYFKGKKVDDILLKVKLPLWRTWSFKTIADKSLTGPWRVDITSVDGKLLKRLKFEVT